MNLAYGQGGLKLEINIPPQYISAKSKGGLIIEGGVSSSEYGTHLFKIERIIHLLHYTNSLKTVDFPVKRCLLLDSEGIAVWL